MQLPYKIILINLAVCAIPPLAIAAGDGFNPNTLFFLYGLFGMAVGAISLLITLILAIAGNKKPGLIQGFLISGILFFITGFFTMSLVSFGR